MGNDPTTTAAESHDREPAVSEELAERLRELLKAQTAPTAGEDPKVETRGDPPAPQPRPQRERQVRYDLD